MEASKAVPNTEARICSTSPAQPPQEPAALVQAGHFLACHTALFDDGIGNRLFGDAITAANNRVRCIIADA